MCLTRTFKLNSNCTISQHLNSTCQHSTVNKSLLNEWKWRFFLYFRYLQEFGEQETRQDVPWGTTSVLFTIASSAVAGVPSTYFRYWIGVCWMNEWMHMCMCELFNCPFQWQIQAFIFLCQLQTPISALPDPLKPLAHRNSREPCPPASYLTNVSSGSWSRSRGGTLWILKFTQLKKKCL